MAQPVGPYYEYQPLDHRHIRLIRMHRAGRHGASGAIVVDIHQQSLDDADFDARSYTWGPPTLEEQDEAAEQVFIIVERCYPVLCNGRVVRITRSLRDVLRKMRGLLEEPEAATHLAAEAETHRKSACTWADGICINQGDLPERARQVAILGELYRKAKIVFACVGGEGRERRNTLELVVLWGHHAAKAEAVTKQMKTSHPLSPL
ncbi:hypothetical protein B0A55_10493 [Friedmanniomyces simplex]|uniref:Heterokaryon incompatibility domain-containing protein n=1 Tax=Friedmanniomyces simplex TaxID=329884 RepID=A0A4V5NGB3_9PEZI|nr:hypothetical protein B0A55_10493 [Friedmanniomyces simplex]